MVVDNWWQNQPEEAEANIHRGAVCSGILPSKIKSGQNENLLKVPTLARQPRWHFLMCEGHRLGVPQRDVCPQPDRASGTTESQLRSFFMSFPSKKNSPALPGVCVCVELLKRSKTCTISSTAAYMIFEFYLDDWRWHAFIYLLLCFEPVEPLRQPFPDLIFGTVGILIA